jgi:acetylornithine deacetylase/succinyl-diaminopimelate desuccinylase-like protein
MKILLAVASLIPILPLVPEVLGSASGEPAYLYAAPMPDFSAAREEAVRFLSDYLRIDTVNPPGNETRGAQYLQSILAREGIPSEIFELVPGRGNLVARLNGNGAKKPVLGHIDVVGVEREKWTVDPFGGLVRNGFLYGRGATDDKSHGVAGLETLLLLHRLKIPLDRDVIFLAEAGEESSYQVGIDFMVERHWDEEAFLYTHLEDPAVVEKIRSRDPRLDALLRTTIVPTIEQGGFRDNTIPATAEATLMVRPLPDEDVPALMQRMREVIDDPAVELIPAWGSRPAAPPSRLNTEMFLALERVQRRLFPQAITLPAMATGTSDSAQLRAKGVQAYGVGSFGSYGAHGNDERISVQGLGALVEFLYNAVVEIAATK